MISLAALGILLATNAAAPEDVADTQNDAQVGEPETSPQPMPEQEQETEEGDLAEPEEQPTQEEEQGEETTQEGQSAGRGGAIQGGQTTQQDTPAPGLPGPSTATVEVTGNSAYYCSLGVIGEPETVQGRRPTSYEVEVETGGTSLDTVMAACQKISPGTLAVLIRYDDEVVAQDETDARLGTVSLSWNPLEEQQVAQKVCVV